LMDDISIIETSIENLSFGNWSKQGFWK
jgi:hypothetical protein